MSGWFSVGHVSDIPPLGARVVRYGDRKIAVFRTADGKIFAIDDRCPHKHGPLSQGIVHGHRVTCPLHNWVIELASGTAAAPDEGCVHTYPVEVDGGVIRLCIEPSVSAVSAAEAVHPRAVAGG